MTVQPLHSKAFWHDGRGPQLSRVHYNDTGEIIRAIDYRNPDREIRHVLFERAQVFMFTPEEVGNYLTSLVDWSKTERAALVCLGKSARLKSFAQQHLKAGQHLRLMFYDDFLDVICAEVSVKPPTHPTGG